MNEIRYDHDNINSIAAALRDRAHDLRRDAEVGAAEALEAIKTEARRYTRSGTPAPIYSDVLREADTALAAIVRKASLLAAAMEDHATVLEGGSAGALAIEEEAVRALTSVDPDAPVNVQKPAPLTTAEREQWRAQEQAAQATLPGGSRWTSKVAADDTTYRPLV